MAKVCDFVDEATNQCLQWSVQQVNWLDQLNQLSQAETNRLLTEIVGFWLLCWGYKALLNFINRG